MNIQRLLVPALAAGVLVVPVAVMAATAPPANLAVSLKINSTCAINNATLTFPPKAGLTTVTDGEAQITLTCTNGTPYNIRFNNGTNFDSGTRRMKSGTSNYVEYNIFRESGRTTILGTTDGTNTIAGTGTGASDTKTAYGRVPIQPTAAIGDYTDTVQMTLAY